MIEHISTKQWLDFPISTRQALVQIFDIPRSSTSYVEDNRVISDGHTQADLDESITLEKIQAYLGSKDDNFYKLFGEVIKKIENYEEETSARREQGSVEDANGTPRKTESIESESAENNVRSTKKARK